MARIRTVKPEFWEDEVVGLLPRDARLLFIATFNLADDEGLLRWTPAYIKSSAFIYDEDLSLGDAAKLMTLLADAGLVFPYIGGMARQQMACIVNFRKHQKINRPQKSKLPPPSLQSVQVRRMYARRDNWTCQLCGNPIPENPVKNDAHNLSIDHIEHKSKGGQDYPSNVRATHQACNKSRRDTGGDEDFTAPRSLAGLTDSLSDSMSRSMNASVNDSMNESSSASIESQETLTASEIFSVNDSLTDSLSEGKGKEGKGGEGSAESAAAADPPQPPKYAVADELTNAFWERYKTSTAQSYIAVRGVIRTAVANGLHRDDIARALDALGSEGRAISGGTLQIALQQIKGRHLRAVSGDSPRGGARHNISHFDENTEIDI